MREGPGPAHYEPYDPHNQIPSIKLGPGFSSGKETPENIKCKKLYKKWSAFDSNINKEQLLIDEEMERIEKKELEILMMSRGLRNIINERIERNGGVKLKKKRKRKRKKKIVIPERIGW